MNIPTIIIFAILSAINTSNTQYMCSATTNSNSNTIQINVIQITDMFGEYIHEYVTTEMLHSKEMIINVSIFGDMFFEFMN
jgi:hypothetical protein